MNRLQQIQQRIEPLKAALVNHPLYGEIDSLESLRLFMEHHIFAVWDFMSLLKALQRRICCVAVPWLPPSDAASCRLLNEIVLAEESDDDGHGGHASHFELYHHAMKQCGANTNSMDNFLKGISRGNSIAVALESARVPECASRFVRHTFDVIEGDNLAAIGAAFTFGREDLLPAVFQRIVEELNVEASGGLEEFKFYLDRHIGLDGEEHGPMAHQLLQTLCGDNEYSWQLVERTAVGCLEARRGLWDGIHERLVGRRLR